ncbi:hypothetical protein P3W53_10505 [Pseudomonas denitrificans (nom. rej.)]|nr:hypothetical protein [Pseudomonas denitrificans (nom. rej.)]
MKAIYLLIALVIAVALFPRAFAEFAWGAFFVLLALLPVAYLFRALVFGMAPKEKKED